MHCAGTEGSGTSVECPETSLGTSANIAAGGGSLVKRLIVGKS
jgi:hypothetical protein